MSWQWRRRAAPPYSTHHEEKRKPRKLDEMRLNELEKKLDHEVSFYVRTQAMNSDGYVQCYTCGFWHKWNDIDAGHYINRRNRGVRWSIINVKPQCKEENRFQEGVQAKFRAKLVQEYGEKKIKELDDYAAFYGSARIPRETLLEQIKKYRALNAPMRKKIREEGL